jgi:hypothetical protein
MAMCAMNMLEILNGLKMEQEIANAASQRIKTEISYIEY